MKPIALLCCLTAALLLVACSKDDECEWTVLVYMAADNGLTESADADINEMEAAGAPAGIQLLVQVDRNSYASDPQAVRYHIHADADTNRITSSVADYLGEIDSGSPQELAAFANWGFNEYPSRRRALIIWGHGDAWYRDDAWKTVCDDYNSASTINAYNGELRQALQSIHYGLDVVMFDACLMQTAEVVAEVGAKADWVVGSPEKVDASGYPYTDLLRVWTASMTPQQMAERTVYAFTDSYRPGGSQFEVGLQRACLSAARADMLNSAEAAVAAFANSMDDESYRELLQQARNDAADYDDREQLADLPDFLRLAARNLPQGDARQAAETARAALEELVPYYDAFGYSNDAAGRLSVWFPETAFEFNAWVTDYAQMLWGVGSEWQQLLRFYLDAGQ